MKIRELFSEHVELERIIYVLPYSGPNDDIIRDIENFLFPDSLIDNLSYFFDYYNKELFDLNKSNGVWISGVHDTGKSTFLKILYYLLNYNLNVNGKTPFELIKESGKINYNFLIEKIEESQNSSHDAILIDMYSSFSSNSKSDLLNLFVNKFNEMRGYSSQIPFLAYFENQLDINGYYDKFKVEFNNIYGSEWINVREDYYFIVDSITQSVENIGFMSQMECESLLDELSEKYNVNFDEFYNEINQYCEDKGKTHHIIFLIDDLDQYIGLSEDSLLEFQKIVNGLYFNCLGKTFIVVNSQVSIPKLCSIFENYNLSIITDYFKLKLSLTWDNLIDVLKLKLLDKNEHAKIMLKNDFYDLNILKSEISYLNAEDFINIYPFIPYQFRLFLDIYESVIEYIMTKSFITMGETNYFEIFREILRNVKENDYGTLISSDLFFNTVINFTSHYHLKIFKNAENNKNLSDFDLRLLKVIYLIGFSKEIEPTSRNITTLMISHINEDVFELNNKVEVSLYNLINETLIFKNEDYYIFLDEY